MDELIKNIKEMGLDWFITSLESWADFTDLDNIEEVLGDLSSYLEEERSCAPN